MTAGLSGRHCVGQASVTHGVGHPEQRRDLRSPGQESVDQSPPGLDDLYGEQNEGLNKSSEVHAQHALLVGQVLLAPATSHRHQESKPCLECPGERDDHRVCPVGFECVERRTKSARSVLELLVEILLVAALVGLTDDFVCRQPRIVGD